MSHILLDGVSCATPDNSPLFPPFSATIARESVGLFGRNGSGKSTLLRAIMGEAQLTSGSIACDGRAALMRQTPFTPGISVSEALGAAVPLARLARIEAGEGAPEDLDQADWTLPAKLERVLADVGLSGELLARSVDGLSGGERCRVKLAAILLAEPDILLLDEPTNDLDEAGRAMVAELLTKWSGPALIATHDRALLESMDAIIELSPSGVLRVGGGWTAFVEQRDAERARAQQALEQAQDQVRQTQAARQARQERQAQRASQGRRSSARKGDTKLEVNARKAQADRSSARNSKLGEDRLGDASAALEQARAQVERIVPVRIDLPQSGLLSSHTVLTAKAITCSHAGRKLFGPLDLSITGPERIAIIGPNGSGKTSLLRILSGANAPNGGGG